MHSSSIKYKTRKEVFFALCIKKETSKHIPLLVLMLYNFQITPRGREPNSGPGNGAGM